MSTQQDAFSKYRINQTQPLDVKSEASKNDLENDNFSKFRISQDETFPKSAFRNLSRGSLRAIEQVLGFPGEIQDLIQSGVLSGLEKIGGIPASKESREKLKQQRGPKSSELKDISQEVLGDISKPRNNLEQKIDEYAETVGQLLGPMKFRKALGVALLGSGAKEGVNILGGLEKSQDASKLGTMFLATLYNPKGALQYAGQQFHKSNALSKGASIEASNLKNNVDHLIQSLEKGVSTPSKNAVLKPAKEIVDKVKKNKIAIDDLTAAKRDLNTLMGDPALLKREKNLLKTLGKEIDQSIKPYEKINPAFGKAYRPANEIYGAVMQGNKASNFINKTLGPKSVLATLGGELALGHPEAIIPTLSAAGAIIGTAKTVDFFSRLKRSPELRKLYSKALLSAAKEDAGALRKYEQSIMNLLKKED